MRAAIGARFARRFVVEVGYSAFALGGTVNSDRLDQMTLTEEMQLPEPESVPAGEARGLFDVSAGVSF